MKKIKVIHFLKKEILKEGHQKKIVIGKGAVGNIKKRNEEQLAQYENLCVPNDIRRSLRKDENKEPNIGVV